MKYVHLMPQNGPSDVAVDSADAGLRAGWNGSKSGSEEHTKAQEKLDRIKTNDEKAH